MKNLICSFIILGIICTMLFCCSCSEKESYETTAPPEMSNEIAAEILKEQWSSYDNKNTEIPSFIKSFEKASSFEVTSFTDDGEGHYTVTVNVTSPDISTLITEAQENINSYMSSEDIDMLLTELIDNASDRTSEHKAIIIKDKDSYYTEFNQDFVDAMYGYAVSSSLTKLEELLSSER